MSTIKRFWNNVVRPTLNDALDKFNDDERDDQHHDEPAVAPTRDLSALEREVAEQRRRLEEAERRLRAAQSQPQSQPQQPPRPTQPRPEPQPQPARPARAPRGGRDPFLEEAERELDEELRRSQNRQQSPQQQPSRQRPNISDDDAARWVAEQQAQRGQQQARRPQGGPQPQRRSAALEISQHYAMLKLPNGATIEQVKDSYRRLMREHHPDRFANDPARHRQATELTQKLSRAFMELRRHLGDIR